MSAAAVTSSGVLDSKTTVPFVWKVRAKAGPESLDQFYSGGAPRVTEVEVAEERDPDHVLASSRIMLAVSAGLVIIGQWPERMVRRCH